MMIRKIKMKSVFSILLCAAVCMMGNVQSVKAMEVDHFGIIQHGIPQGAVTETQIKSGKELNEYDRYYYNEQGLIIKKEGWRADGVKNCTYIYEYDIMGNMIRETFYDKKESCLHDSIYKYNEKGQLIETGMILSDGRYITNCLYLYEGNKMLTWPPYDEEAEECKEFDSAGRIVLWQLLNNPYDPRRTEYSYDEKGRLAKVVSRYMGEYKEVADIYEYTYDDHDIIETETQSKSLGDGGAIFYCGTRNFVKQYDEFGRLIQIGTIGFDGTFDGYKYTY